MQEFTVTLLSAEEIAENTMQYNFTNPKDFVFVAGQYVILDVINSTHKDDRPSFRSLSIASAPHEDIISFIMRHSDSAFKKNLKDLRIGDSVTIKGPLGHMKLPEDETVPVVFLAAGVGITPARSMIRHAEHVNIQNPFILLYSNIAKVSAACIDELTESTYPQYQCINILSQEEGEWDGARGRITKDLIEEYVSDPLAAQFYIIGTTGFVNAMKEILTKLNVTKDQLHIDNFG